MERKCCKCGLIKPLEEFHRDSYKKLGRRYYCKACAPKKQEYFAAYYQKHKYDKFIEYRRRHRQRNPDRTEEHRKARLSNYNLTIEQYTELFNSQNGVCAICGAQETKKQSLSIDHDHSCCAGAYSCGRCIRGLLCHKCNSILGLARDGAELLLKSIDYLKRIKNG